MVDISDDTKVVRRRGEVMGVVRRRRWSVEGKDGSLPRRPAPEHLIKSGLPTEAMVASVLVDAKYDWHLPLYRQAKMLAGQGLDLDHSTLAFWVGYPGGSQISARQRSPLRRSRHAARRVA
jgi:transposase